MQAELPADHRGASVIIIIDDRFLWTISARDHWRTIGRILHVNYEGVGGGVEPAESFEGAVIRECKEETGCEPEILPSRPTFVLDEVKGTVTTVNYHGVRPFMVWRKRLRGRKTLTTCTYLARISGTPKPKEEIPALLYAPTALLLKGGRTTIRELLTNGSELVERTRIPRSAFITPWGTPFYLRELVRRGTVDLPTLTSLHPLR